MRKLFMPLCGLLFIFSVSVACFGMTGEEVARKVYERDTGKTSHILVKMDLIDRDGSVSERYLETWSLEYNVDLQKTIMVFHAPASVKNTRFLQVENRGRDDDKWIYLPALKRVRRIASAEGGNSFMGTDFTYDDMSPREVEQDTHELLREEKHGEYDCYVVKSTSRDPADSEYAYALKWVADGIWIPVKIELYDKKGDLLKVMTEQRIQEVQGYWTSITSEMKNVQTGHATTIEIKKLVYDEPLNENLFTTQFLKTGRP